MKPSPVLKLSVALANGPHNTSLFAPFARNETQGKSGTGLGLTIARQAADLLGTKLHAQSKVGEGTTFHLDLPAGKEK